MKFSASFAFILLLSSISISQARLGNRFLEEDDEPNALSQLLGSILGVVLNIFPFIEHIPFFGDVIFDIYADSLTYNETVHQVLLDLGFTDDEIPDNYCNIVDGSRLLTLCDEDTDRLTFLALWEPNDGDFEPATSTGFISKLIGQLTELQYLVFTYPNILTNTIPGEIGDLNELYLLQISNQENLTGSVPEDFSNLSNLTLLALNDIPDLTGTIPDLNSLTRMNIDNTGISDFPSDFCESLDFLTYENTNVSEDKCSEA